MNFTEKWGDDVDSAVELALAELKASRDEVEIEVLEEPSRGFLGIGAKLALVRVTRKGEEKEEKKTKKERNNKPEKKQAVSAGEEKTERSRKKPEKKPLEELAPGSNLEELDFHKVMDPLPVCEEHPAKTFLQNVAGDMGLNLEMVCKADENNVFVDIKGADSGTIIGKRGQTLDAIQYLTSLVVNKDKGNYVKVVVDAENYRMRRERTLEQLAHKLAGKVARTKRSVRLEPMNPYERKVIHATLQTDDRVVTRSEGEDPYRRVIIEMK